MAADETDSRQVRLWSTPLAAENLARLRQTWAGLLGGSASTVDLDTVLAGLRTVEAGLSQTHRGRDPT